jgi:DNA polymerase-1
VNVQTIPRGDTTVKRAFVPKLDYLMSLDYPNIELKILAWYLDGKGFPEMAEEFRKGTDMHAQTAAGIFKKPLSKVSKEERHVGKTLNFSIVYGGGIPTLLRQGVAEDGKAANKLLRGFHSAWPGIGWEGMHRDADEGTLIASIKERLATRGYITTPWGRHLHPRASHAALNNLCQGAAADLMKWACVNVHQHLDDGGYRSHVVNVVHDDLVLDVVEDELDELMEFIPEWMTYDRFAELVPIRPEPSYSDKSWADVKD